MPCYVPFDDKSLDLSFVILRPRAVFTDELIDALKYFSFHTECLGCPFSSILNSIHGNLIVWYGAWIKRSQKNREILHAALLSCLGEISKLAIIVQHGFVEAYSGESKDNHNKNRAKFSNGDTVFMSGMVPINRDDPSDLSYACLALLRSYFSITNGILSAVCLRHLRIDDISCDYKPMVGTLQVWKSVGDCYAWLLDSDHRNTIKRFIAHLISDDDADVQFEIFKVVYVSTDDAPVNIGFRPSSRPIKNVEDGDDV